MSVPVKRPSELLADGRDGKRTRHDDGHDSDEDSERVEFAITDLTVTLTPTSPWTRDTKYYFEDGSCVLLVENTLFKVHRSRLTGTPSAFETLFALPSGAEVAEGGSDENPVSLHGDTAREFRSFLWALYALPHEVSHIHTSASNSEVDRLLDVTQISHKYELIALVAWALDVCHTIVSSPSPSSPPLSILDRDTIARMFRLASLCENNELVGTLSDLIRKRMRTFTGAASTVSTEWVALAMTISDELELPALKGPAYMEMLQLGPEKWTGITPQQKFRLLAGYYELTNRWEELRKHPPKIPHGPACSATWQSHSCSASWQEFWRTQMKTEGIIALPISDLSGKIRLVLKELERFGSATYMNIECRLAAKNVVANLISEVESRLPQYFST